ncbi:MAG: leucine-rich repeat protein, partial [Oscillospiraceae bacterium]|nr:leucine-rich repeat protein [Oscillospiraceae bacterium]
MKKYNKPITIVLAALMLLSSLPITALPVSALASKSVLQPEIADAFVPPIPDGYHFTGITYKNEFGKMIYYIEGEPSEYGWVDGYWINVAGDPIEREEDPFIYADKAVNANEVYFPSKYDAREMGYVTPVEDQIGGTCWAHAAVACMEANAIKKGYGTKDSIDFSEYYIAWYARQGYYQGISDAANDGYAFKNLDVVLNGGGNPSRVGDATNNFSGPVLESKYNFKSISEKLLLKEMSESFDYSAKFDYDYVVTSIHSPADSIESIKNAILKYGVVQISYYDSIGYYTRSNSDNKPVAFYNPNNTTSTNHAVTIVGWDDNFSLDNFTVDGAKPSKPGAWLIKNSWGDYWGNDGYFWISYEEPSLSKPYVYEVESREEYQNAYLYDGFGAYGFISTTAAANVFTAKGMEYLSKVSSGSSVNKYNFSIYKLSNGYTSPVDGELIYSQTGNDNEGKYIDVKGDVLLSEGEIFSVVFNDISYINAEYQKSENYERYLNFQSEVGQSWYLEKGEWVDSYGSTRNNVCIRAFTRDVTTGPFSVKFSCPGFYNEFRTAVDGIVELPETEGYTWVFSKNGEPFDGTGVTRDITVESHCYPTHGAPNAVDPCKIDYRCIYCGTEMLPFEIEHTFDADIIVPATATSPGYTMRICSICGKKEKESFTIYDGADGGIFNGLAWQVVDGVLSIAGEGAIPDFGSAGDAPWYKNYASVITSLVVNEGITETGTYSFAKLTSLQEMTLPSTLIQIGNYSFSGASALKEFVAPENLIFIGDHAFEKTTSLASITYNSKIMILGTYVFTNSVITEAVLPSSVIKYGERVYSECNKVQKIIIEDGITSLTSRVFYAYSYDSELKELVIPASVKYISHNFYSLGMFTLQNITVDQNNQDYCSVDGVLFTKDMKTICFYPPEKTGLYYHIPQTVSKMSYYAFASNSYLNYLDMSDCAVTVIPTYCFYSAKMLKGIDWPKNLTQISSSAFMFNRTEKFYIPSSVTKLDSSAISNCYNRPTIYTDSETSAAKAYADKEGYDCIVLSQHEHEFSSELYYIEPNCAQEGFLITGCVCSQFLAEVKSKSDDHLKTNGVVTNPTCNTGGYTTYICTRCGKTYQDDFTSATGNHNFTSATVKDDALKSDVTCETAATYYYSCTVCGEV